MRALAAPLAASDYVRSPARLPARSDGHATPANASRITTAFAATVKAATALAAVVLVVTTF